MENNTNLTSNQNYPGAVQQPTIVQPTPVSAPATVQRTPAKQISRSTRERSKTLMRHVVKKPQGEIENPSIKVQAPVVTEPVEEPAHQVQSKLSVQSVNPDRQRRAAFSSRSQFVSRFSRTPLLSTPRREESVSPVVIAPTFEPVPEPVPVTISTPEPEQPQQVATPVVAVPVITPAPETPPPAAIIPVRTNRTAQATTVPVTVRSAAQPVQLQPTQPVSEPKKLDIFERALQNAPIEEQAPLKLPRAHRVKRLLRNRLAVVAAASLAVVVVGSVIAYTNTSKIDLMLASSKAGFHATLPGYNPGGYGLAKISYSSSGVAESFHNNKNRATYTVTEQPSSWSSDTLRTSYVANAASQDFQTIQDDGLTIYIYGMGNATWVDHGVWYQINSSDALNTQELVQTAISLDHASK